MSREDAPSVRGRREKQDDPAIARRGKLARMGLWEHRGFTVEDDDWPLVRCRFPPQPDVEGYTRLFEHYVELGKHVELGKRGGSIAWLIDMRGFNPLTSPPTVRKAAAGVFERHREALARCTLCEARVIDGAAVRGVVTAFDWLTGNKWPCSNFATREEARRWIDEQRAKAAQG